MGLFYTLLVFLLTGRGGHSQHEVELIQQQIFRFNPAQNYEMNIYYPEILGKNEATHLANVGIQYLTSQAIGEFQKEAFRFNELCSLNMVYKLYFNKGDILCIHFTKYVKLPSYNKDIQHTFNYCFKERKAIKFDDVFTSRNALTKYLQTKLSSQARFSKQALDYFTFDSEYVYFCFNNGLLGTENCPDILPLAWKEVSGFLNQSFCFFAK